MPEPDAETGWRARQGAKKSSKAECPANKAGLFPSSTLFASQKEVI